MKQHSSLQSAQEQAKALALAFSDNEKFDLEAATEQLSQHLNQKPLSEKQLEFLNRFKNKKISSSDVQKKFSSLKKYLGESTTDNSQPDDEEAISHSKSVLGEISSKLTKKRNKKTNSNKIVPATAMSSNSFIPKEAVSNNGQYDIPLHPLLKKYPEGTDDEKLAVFQDIEVNGIRHPLFTYKGKLADGRIRFEGAKKLRIPFQIVEWQGDESELQSFMDSIHILNKDHTPTQKAFFAFENKDRFKKQKILSDKKNELEGAKSKRGHDTNKLANTYYKASAGEVAKVKTLTELAAKTLLYEYTRAAKITIEVALYLAKNKIFDDKALLDLISKHKLNSSQSRELSLIKNDEEADDLYEQINSESDSREVKKLIRYYSFKDTIDILFDLMSGSINLKEAQAMKDKLFQEQASGDTSSETKEPSQNYEIDNKVYLRITKLAIKSDKSINDFLTDVIDNYERTLKGSK